MTFGSLVSYFFNLAHALNISHIQIKEDIENLRQATNHQAQTWYHHLPQKSPTIDHKTPITNLKKTSGQNNN